MINFKDLGISKQVEKSTPLVKTPSKQIHKVTITNFQQLVGDTPKNRITITKEESTRRHLTEPGHKIPTANYQQLGQFCDNCEDVTPHVFNPEKKYIQCQICKTGHKTR